VSYASNKDEIERREIKGLQRASELLKCENLLIITWDYEDEVRIENKKIVFKPLWKWLLT
jgi:predicted AAA+ superfamily ATPase